MDPVIVQKSLTASSVNCIALAQTKASAGNLVLNGGSVAAGVATLDGNRRVLITSDGDDSARTFRVIGTVRSGQPVVDEITGANAGSAYTDLDFYTVGTIHVDGAIANHVTIGTNGVGSTPWINPSWSITPFKINIVTQVTGSVTYNVETTLEDYWTPSVPSAVVDVTAVVSGATAAANLVLDAPVRGYRYTITTGTGTLAAEGLQAGIANY